MRIDLGWMIRAGLAMPGRDKTGTLNWTYDGDPAGSLSYEARMADADNARLVLTFTRKMDGKPDDVRQEIRLVCTRPHFGGQRWWMICPYQGHRIGKLYLPNGAGRFASRTAWRVGYRSQQSASRDRPFDRLNRLQRRLGCREGYDALIKRPKGMWHRTHERHEARYRELSRACDSEMMAALEILRQIG